MSAVLIDEAKKINSSLQRVRETIQLGVFQVQSAGLTVAADGESIQSSLYEHKYVLKSALDSTSNRLSKIKYAELREQYVLMASITFFVSVVVYIIAKRTHIFHIMMSPFCSAS